MIATLLPTELAARVDLLRSVASRLLTNDRGATSSLRMWLLFVAFACNGYPREPWLCDALVHVGAIVHGVAKRSPCSFAVAAAGLVRRFAQHPDQAEHVLAEAVTWASRLDPRGALTLQTEPPA